MKDFSKSSSHNHLNDLGFSNKQFTNQMGNEETKDNEESAESTTGNKPSQKVKHNDFGFKRPQDTAKEVVQVPFAEIVKVMSNK